MITIISLTLKEAFRRRTFVISLLVVALLLVGAFIPIRGRLAMLPVEQATRLYSSIYVFFAIDIVKFFASVFSIALGAGAISAELERGVLSAILPKPISRISVYAGKWIGLFVFVALNIVFWELIIWGVARYRAPQEMYPQVWSALPALIIYPAVFLTLALFFSTFGSFPLSAGLAILCTGIGWAEGILFLLHKAFDISYLSTLSKVAGYLMPLGRMSRNVTLALGELPGVKELPPGARSAILGGGGPFKQLENGPWDLPYLLFYVALIFLCGAIIFGRRDV